MGKKISELDEITELDGTEQIPVEKGGANGKVSVESIFETIFTGLEGFLGGGGGGAEAGGVTELPSGEEPETYGTFLLDGSYDFAPPLIGEESFYGVLTVYPNGFATLLVAGLPEPEDGDVVSRNGLWLLCINAWRKVNDVAFPLAVPIGSQSVFQNIKSNGSAQLLTDNE